jgi:hypothetical protein
MKPEIVNTTLGFHGQSRGGNVRVGLGAVHCGQTLPETQTGKFDPGYVQHVVPTPHCAHGQASHPGGAEYVRH